MIAVGELMGSFRTDSNPGALSGLLNYVLCLNPVPCTWTMGIFSPKLSMYNPEIPVEITLYSTFLIGTFSFSSP